MSSLYVWNLDTTVNEMELDRVVRQGLAAESLTSIKIYRDHTNRSLGRAQLTFGDINDALKSMTTLSNLPIGDRIVDISFGSFPPHLNELEHHDHARNLPIGNLPIATNQVEHHDHARNLPIGNLPIATNQVEHEVHVGNLSPTTTDENLRTEFSHYGLVVHAYVVKAADGTSKGYGFVKFHSPESGLNAINALNGKMVAGNIWRVNRAYRKSEREKEIREAMEKGVVLYVSNLPYKMNETELQELFCRFGDVIACRIRRNQDGKSKGDAFVEFSTQDSVARAMSTIHGTKVGGRTLYLSLATYRRP